jgi:hypothetical protein
MNELPRGHLDRAIGVVERESEIVAAERTSFERFRARIADVEPRPSADGAPTGASVVGATPHGGAVGGASASMSTEAPVDASLRSVRRAYRETVMAVPHFDAEYGDGLAESLAAEFGAAVASQVTDGTQLTPVVYQTLVRGASEAVSDRKSFQASLARERESLLDIRSGLEDCERRIAAAEERLGEPPSSEELSELDARFAAVESTCSGLATERQSLVHGRSDVDLSGVTGTSLVNYLHRELEVSCPALATLADAVERIRDRRRRCLR